MAEPLLSPVQNYLGINVNLFEEERIKIRVESDAEAAARSRVRRPAQEVEDLTLHLSSILKVLTVPNQEYDSSAELDLDALLNHGKSLDPIISSLQTIHDRVQQVLRLAQQQVIQGEEELQSKCDGLRKVVFMFSSMISVLEMAKTDRDALLKLETKYTKLEKESKELKDVAKQARLQVNALHTQNVKLSSDLAQSKVETDYTKALLTEEQDKTRQLSQEVEQLKRQIIDMQRGFESMKKRDDKIFGGGFDIDNIF